MLHQQTCAILATLVASASQVSLSFSRPLISYDFCPDVCKSLLTKRGLQECIREAPPDCTGKAALNITGLLSLDHLCSVLTGGGMLHYSMPTVAWHPEILLPGLIKDDQPLLSGTQLSITFTNSADCSFNVVPLTSDHGTRCGLDAIASTHIEATRKQREIKIGLSNLNRELKASTELLFSPQQTIPECQELPKEIRWDLVFNAYWAGTNITALPIDFGGEGDPI